jgi:hypothetical protein
VKSLFRRVLDEHLFVSLQPFLQRFCFPEIFPQRLEQLKMNVRVSQIVEDVQPLLQALSKFYCLTAESRGLQKIQHRQQPPRFDAQRVNCFL